MTAKKVILAQIPYADTLDLNSPWNGSGTWPANWIDGDFTVPFVAAFRLTFVASGEQTVRVHASADERYELYLDGERIGRGPERGEARHWYFESYDLSLAAGEHCLVARVWALGGMAPMAQFSLRPGFFLCTDLPELAGWLATGKAAWEVKQLPGYSFTPPSALFGTGYRVVIDGKSYPWGVERGEGTGWAQAKTLHAGYNAEMRSETLPWEHLLTPAVLPAMLEEPRRLGRVRHISAPALTHTHSLALNLADHLPAEETAWTDFLNGLAPLTLPPHTRRRVVVDLENYYCAYPELVTSGGAAAAVRMGWSEAPYDDLQTWTKGRRGEIYAKYFVTPWTNEDATGSQFFPDGGAQRRFSTLWWEAGRYVEILVETNNRPLTLESLVFRETRYPLENEARFSASDARLESVMPIGFRALQMCAHETYMDCPHYEQLMYVGDTRLEALVTYVTTRDDRLPRKALQMFDASRLTNGLTQSRFPSRSRQMIPPFSLWWVGMVYDFMLWRGDLPFIRSLMPGVRAVLDAFTQLRGGDGLVRSPAGWNFIDWVPAWQGGVAPGGWQGEICAALNWLVVYALAKAAELEEVIAEPEQAARCRRLAQETSAALDAAFWDEKGLYADDLAHEIFSEHCQCLAVLGGTLPEARRAAIARSLFTSPGLTQTTIFFTHYYFETCRELGRMDVFLERMTPWFEMVDFDFKTTYESETARRTRSDCHAWGAHPLYHYFASLLGIRPLEPGFGRVEIRPQLAGLTHIEGAVCHPAGEIQVELSAQGQTLSGSVLLPAGIQGVFSYGGAAIPLAPGWNKI